MAFLWGKLSMKVSPTPLQSFYRIFYSTLYGRNVHPLSIEEAFYFAFSTSLLSDDTLFVCVVLFLDFYTDAPHPTPHHPTPSGASPQGEAFQKSVAFGGRI